MSVCSDFRLKPFLNVTTVSYTFTGPLWITKYAAGPAEQVQMHRFNSQGTEIFPFSYFENPWLECGFVIKVIKNINKSHKTRTYGLNFR